MSTSRERMLAQIERCVQHQKPEIEPGPSITGEQEAWQMGEYVAPEEWGNGEAVDCDASAVWGLRPPGDDPPPVAHCTGDWA